MCSLDSQESSVSSGWQLKLWSDCTYAQADLHLCWVLIAKGIFSHVAAYIWVSTWQNLQNGMYAQRRLSLVWSESLLYTQWIAIKNPSFLHADAKTLVSLGGCWAHIPFCRFCHALARFCFFSCKIGFTNFFADCMHMEIIGQTMLADLSLCTFIYLITLQLCLA